MSNLLRVEARDFVVEGAGEFPYDMLRFDNCWPATGEDAAKMQHAFGGHMERRRIKLRCYRELATPTVTAARWDSFVWRVVEAD